MLHHERAVDRLVERESRDARNLALILTGSVARGTERADSDVDVYLVVTEDAFTAARAARRIMYTSTEGIDYDGGYFDVKLASVPYLDAAAQRGDDPTRASFEQSTILWSRLDGLEQRIERITTPPESTWRAHEASFLAQAQLHGGYFLPGALRTGDSFLAANAAVHLANAACRVVLARHRVLFQGPKYLTSTVRAIDGAPHELLPMIDALVRSPNESTAADVLSLLTEELPPVHPDETLSRFVEDSELAWLAGTLPPEYR